MARDIVDQILANIKMKDAEKKGTFHFLVKEAHCKGHDEENLQTVTEFRHDKELDSQDLLNQGWVDIMMKMLSWRRIGGPNGRDVSPQAKQMFFLD